MQRQEVFGIPSGFVMIVPSALSVLVCSALLHLFACDKVQPVATHQAPTKNFGARFSRPR
jgi:hypothetical protein